MLSEKKLRKVFAFNILKSLRLQISVIRCFYSGCCYFPVVFLELKGKNDFPRDFPGFSRPILSKTENQATN